MGKVVSEPSLDELELFCHRLAESADRTPDHTEAVSLTHEVATIFNLLWTIKRANKPDKAAGLYYVLESCRVL